MDNQRDSELVIQQWLKAHERNRKGERKRRISGGLGHAETLFLKQVWWPAFMRLEGLHPEYEVKDFKDGSRFIDFAYFAGDLKLCIEIDGYGSHWRDLTRWQFADHLMRQNQLVIDGWHVLRFAYEEIKDKPRKCQQTIQQFLGRSQTSGDAQLKGHKLNSYERDLVRLFHAHGKISVRTASEFLHLSTDRARRVIAGMVDKELLLPARPELRRIHHYVLAP
ncbi:DUF559 domain-containing protein [Paenibacillus methanolicus]|uniref:Uncharacterized protein DUF559 n=1 Tax=Paenibacillus methanolicus TaxID=582686 RepID=A0A5S5BN20_9BACL|nr:DUF559 domain-containing protein [Paenibacillus methanolicus]TYP68397.1 uncharacterized protein DUF559 [Paenibacillus methanolicus]